MVLDSKISPISCKNLSYIICLNISLIMNTEGVQQHCKQTLRAVNCVCR